MDRVPPRIDAHANLTIPTNLQYGKNLCDLASDATYTDAVLM